VVSVYFPNVGGRWIIIILKRRHCSSIFLGGPVLLSFDILPLHGVHILNPAGNAIEAKGMPRIQKMRTVRSLRNLLFAVYDFENTYGNVHLLRALNFLKLGDCFLQNLVSSA